jgi:hypothetical protein
MRMIPTIIRFIRRFRTTYSALKSAYECMDRRGTSVRLRRGWGVPTLAQGRAASYCQRPLSLWTEFSARQRPGSPLEAPLVGRHVQTAQRIACGYSRFAHSNRIYSVAPLFALLSKVPVKPFLILS